MFCEKCGKPIEEGAAFCTGCGTPVKPAEAVEEAAVVESTPVEETVVEESVEQAPVEETAVEAATGEAQGFVVTPPADAQETVFNDPTAEENPKKKKLGKKFWIWLSSAVVAIGLILAIIFNFSWIKGNFIKWFGSDADYYKFVEEQNISSATDDVFDLYAKLYDALTGGKVGSSGSLEFMVGDGADIISEKIGFDLSDFDGMKIDWNLASNDSKYNIELGFGQDGKDVISAQALADLNKGEAFVKVPQIGNEYLYADISDVLGSDGYNAYKDVTKNIKDILPEPKKLEKFVNRYIDTALDAIPKDDVKHEGKKVTVNGVTQKLTKITVKIDENTVCKMLEAVMKEAIDDKVLKEYLEDAFSNISEFVGADDIDVWDELTDALEEGLDELDPDKIGEFDIELVTYVNGSHEIVGREISVNDEEIMYFVTVQKGKNVATVFETGDIVMEGKFTESGKGLNGKMSVEVQNGEEAMEVATFTYENVNQKKQTGKFIIEPSQELMTQFASEFSSELSELGVSADQISAFLKPALVVELGKDTTAISIENNGSLVFGFKLTAKSQDKVKINMPSKDDAIDVTDSDALQEWASDLGEQDLEEIIGEVPFLNAIFGVNLNKNNYTDNSQTPDYDYNYDDYNYGASQVIPEDNYDYYY